MEKPRNIQLRLLSYGVIAYMMLAVAWWSVLLFTKNRDAYQAKRDNLRILMIARPPVQLARLRMLADLLVKLSRLRPATRRPCRPRRRRPERPAEVVGHRAVRAHQRQRLNRTGAFWSRHGRDGFSWPFCFLL